MKNVRHDGAISRLLGIAIYGMAPMLLFQELVTDDSLITIKLPSVPNYSCR
jgi:hypothetical protein